MSLSSTDITKRKRLSLRKVNLPAPEVRKEPTKAPQKPPTQEEVAYSRIVAERPIIEELVERLDLVSPTTGQRIRKVDLSQQTLQEEDKPKLIALAQQVIKPEASYTKQQIVDRIVEATNVSQQRAETGFNLILQAGALETLTDRYYLKGSTPF